MSNEYTKGSLHLTCICALFDFIPPAVAAGATATEAPRNNQFPRPHDTTSTRISKPGQNTAEKRSLNFSYMFLITEPNAT